MSEPPVYNPPPAELVDYGNAAPPKKPRWKLWLGLGLGGAVLLVGVCGGGFAWFIMRGKAEVEPVAEAYLAKIESQDYSGAYDSIGPEWKGMQSLEQFTRFQTLFRKHLGPLQSKSIDDFNIKRETGTSVAVMGYSAKFQNAGGTITLTLTNSTGAWKVAGHRVDSPLFAKLLTCPNCKSVNQSLGEFCSSCGKPMTLQED
jgi:hypothetical protein